MTAKDTMGYIRDKIMMRALHSVSTEVVTIPLPGTLFYSGYGMSVFSVEMLFDCILMRYFGNARVPMDTLKLYLSHQTQDGFIRRVVNVDTRVDGMNPFARFENNEHAQPFLFQSALLIARELGGDMSFLEEADYQRLKLYLRHWFMHWVRDDSGLCVWNSAPHGCSDTAFERAGEWKSLFCAGSDLNSYLYAELNAASRIARALGKPRDADDFEAQAERQLERIQRHLWNEQDGIFYDRDVRTGRHIRVKHCHCFDALECGVATPEQAARMVGEHIVNPDEFWTRYPIPSYALNQPGFAHRYVPAMGDHPYHRFYADHPNWRGGMWPHSAYALAHGLARYGYKDEAMHVARQAEALALSDPALHEWYDPLDGHGCGATPFHAGVEILMLFLRTELEQGVDPFAIEDADRPTGSGRVAHALGAQPIPEQL